MSVPNSTFEKHQSYIERHKDYSTESFLYQSSNQTYWTLIRFNDDSVIIYYHDKDNSATPSVRKNKGLSLQELAKEWDHKTENFIDIVNGEDQ